MQHGGVHPAGQRTPPCARHPEAAPTTTISPQCRVEAACLVGDITLPSHHRQTISEHTSLHAVPSQRGLFTYCSTCSVHLKASRRPISQCLDLCFIDADDDWFLSSGILQRWSALSGRGWTMPWCTLQSTSTQSGACLAPRSTLPSRLPPRRRSWVPSGSVRWELRPRPWPSMWAGSSSAAASR